jgi:hypothetical protein
MGPKGESSSHSSDDDDGVMTDEGLDGWEESDAHERVRDPVEMVR